MGYLGQAVIHVTLDEGDATERAYRLEAGLYEDESGLWLEGEQTQDVNGCTLNDQALLDMPPGHIQLLELCFTNMELGALDT